MGYILIYEHLDTSGDYDYWTDEYELFETYSELIDYMAEHEMNWPGYYAWNSIYKTEKNMLDLYLDDMHKVYGEKFEEKMRKIAEQERIEKALKAEREAAYEALLIKREKELYLELSKKYGNNS